MKYGSVLLSLIAAASVCSAAEFYVSPAGSRSGTGSLSSPWDLATALSHPSTVRPGDTIWLRGGTYSGSFQSRLQGDARAPIIVRQYPGERAAIDGASSNVDTLVLGGAHTWYWGFEVLNSSTASRVTTGSDYRLRPAGVTVTGAWIKCINMVIHDVGTRAIGSYSGAENTELYGNIIYYVGYSDKDRNHGEGLYFQNRFGLKRVVDNVIFSVFDSGIHAYGSSKAFLENLTIEGTILFHNGIPGAHRTGWGMVVGGGVIARNVTIAHNYSYYPSWFTRSNGIKPSYGKGTHGLRMHDNYSVGPTPMSIDAQPEDFVAQNNVFVGLIKGFSAALPKEGNAWLMDSPRINRIFVRPNKYEPGRASITIYNWAGADSIPVELKGILNPGDEYEVRAYQNYSGEPVMRGKYDGTAVRLPMKDIPLMPGIGELPNPPVSTFPAFGAFEVRRIKARTKQ